MARTVVIVDDHADFRAQATALLRDAGYDVIGACPDARTARHTIPALHPDLVLLDVQLPDADGFDLAATLPAGPTIVLISTREAADYGTRIHRSPAAAFITKADLSGPTLAQAIGPH
jgi:DNA-binding NarL/FixJ family response regulator